jgi:hypothetical protein
MSRLSITRFVSLGLVAAAILGAVALTSKPAQAQVPPFKAWGPGLTSGQVVKAFKGATQVGTATANAAGNWEIDIPSGGSANVANGDKINFTLDGRDAAETVTFNVGQFVAPPGLKLTVPAAAGPTGATGPTAPSLPPTASSTAKGTLASAPAFDGTGRALAVFNGGTPTQLSTEGTKVGAKGVWVQDADGMYRLLVIGGPAFLNDDFNAKFPNGLGVASVLLVK